MFEVIRTAVIDLWVILSVVVVDLMDGRLAPLLPCFAIGIAASVLILCVRCIRSITWGS